MDSSPARMTMDELDARCMRRRAARRKPDVEQAFVQGMAVMGGACLAVVCALLIGGAW